MSQLPDVFWDKDKTSISLSKLFGSEIVDIECQIFQDEYTRDLQVIPWMIVLKDGTRMHIDSEREGSLWNWGKKEIPQLDPDYLKPFYDVMNPEETEDVE